MALGLRNKKRAAAEAAENTADQAGGGVAVATATKTKKRKPQELLSSVVKESTVGAAVALLRENEPFALPSGKSWIVLGLAVEGIGGLSMKQKGDEAKGSIIELITADEITTVATLDMLELETFGIIPSTKSLGRMDEFSLLKNAKYLWVVLTQTPEGQLEAQPVADATYAQALDIAEGRTSLSQILPEVWEWGGGEAVDPGFPADDDAADPDLSDEPLLGGGLPSGDDDSPFGNSAVPDEEPIDYEALAADAEPDVSLGGEVDLSAFEAQFQGAGDHGTDGGGDQWQDDDAFPASAGAAPEPQPSAQHSDRVVDEAEVRASIARRFLSSDLNLTVDLETFHANFIAGSEVIAFPLEDDTTDWLGRQINQLARQANTELAHMHAGNQDKLRELYVSLMSRHVEQVVADVSTEQEGSFFNRLLKAAKEDQNERQRKAPEDAAVQRRELNERYEAEADARGRQAFEQAVTRYKEQNRPRHERELAEIGLAIERASEDAFDNAQQTILEMRRKEANTRLDMGQTKILDVVMELQQQQRDAEDELVQQWSARMTEVLDTFRKDDIARTEALALQLSRNDEIERIRKEHADRVRDLRRQHATAVDTLSQQLDDHRTAASAELDAHEANWQRELNLERERATSANSNVQQVLSDFSRMSALKDETHTAQMERMRADNEAYAREMERASVVQKRANLVLVVLIVAVAVGALAVGFILGHAVDGSPARPAASAAIASVWTLTGTLPPVS